MSLIILNVDEVRRTLSASGGAFVVHDKEVDIVRFAINSGFADIVLDGQVALRVMYQRPGETEVRAKTLTYYDTDGLHNYYDWQLSQSDLAKNGSLMVALCILDISGGEVSEWHTTPCAVRVLQTIHTDDSDEGDDTITPTVKERVAVLESMIQRVASGAPIVVASASDMTDTDQIYVLSTDGNWYYHNGSAWVVGGEYGTVATDTTLTQPGKPADAKAVGDVINEVKADLGENGIGAVYQYEGTSNKIISHPIKAGVPIYFAVKSGTATGVRFDLRRADNTRVQLLVNMGKDTVYTPTENFNDFIAYPMPWDGESKSVVFLFSQTENGTRQKLYDLDKSYRPELGFNISAQNYTSYFTDANNAPVGRAYVISSNITSAMIANLPMYNQFGILYTANGQTANRISTQIYSGVSGTQNIWYRTSTDVGSVSYNAWKRLIDSADWADVVKNEDIQYLVSDICKYGKYNTTTGGQIFSQTVTEGERYRLCVWDINGAIADNPVLFRTPTGASAVNLRDFRKVINNTYYWDITIPSNTNNIFLYGVKDTGATNIACSYTLIKVTGGIVDTLQTEIDELPSKMTNVRTCKIFKKVVCCGDSYTSGHIQLNGETAVVTNEEFAYPHFMSTLTGNEWVNCGRSGATVLSWMTDERGLPKAQATGHAQAYVIGLMINDQKTSGGVPLGTASDIGTENPTTYYGGMSKIIRELNAISPKAKIFVCTCPMAGGNFDSYNLAVRTIVDAYTGTYPVHCLDLQAHKALYNNKSLIGDLINGHYTAIGYEQFSEILAYIMSDYINNNISDFQNVHQIPYN